MGTMSALQAKQSVGRDRTQCKCLQTQKNWEYINGDKAIPRFSFPAYTGDTTIELLSEQLKPGDYKENNRVLPRAQPFGKPQIAVMTIGGNDALLSK